MMGHSFFTPISSDFGSYAQLAGYSGHTDEIFSAGGAGGAPISFWESSSGITIRNTLDSNDVTLLGLTYYPLEDNERNLQGYVNWIEYALQSNPDLQIFIGLPWSTDPGQFSVEDYRSDWEAFHAAEFHEIVDSLRQAFPGINIYCIPYGRAAIELKTLYERGELSDIDALIQDGSDTSVFIDSNGHAGVILEELVSLIWLQAIYGIDVRNFDYPTDFTTDLRVIAESIQLKHDHDYDAR